MMEEKVYFNAGDLVTLKLDIPNKPVMVVVRKKINMFKLDTNSYEDKKPILMGLLCRWFTANQEMQEAVWSTKDLELVK